MEKKYKLDELKHGMTVTSRELSDIKDVHIILCNAKRIGYMNVQGTIGFIGREITQKAYNLRQAGESLFDVYNDSLEDSEDIFYDE